jgi:CBS domain-containing protein
MRVGDIMTVPVQTIPEYSTIAAAARMMARHNVGILPVCRGDCIVGIITDRDLAVRGLASGADAVITPVRVVMSEHPVVVSPKDSIEEAADVLANNGVRRVPVVEGDRPIGMLSADDLARFAGHDDLVLDLERKLATYMAPPILRRMANAG